MRRLALILILSLISSSAFAGFGRSTSFDDREICEKDKGVWREFGSSAADNCENKLDQYAISAQELTYACDCGRNKCWDGKKCVLMLDYKKVYDQKQAEENKKIEEAKKLRHEQYQDNSNERLKSLIGKSGQSGDAQASASSNLSQFYDKIPQDDIPVAPNNSIVNNVSQQAQSFADQSVAAAKQVKDGPIGQAFSGATPAPTVAPSVAKTPEAIVNAVDNSISSGPTPFFLQQQAKAKQEAEAAAKTSPTTVTSSAPTISSDLPELPQIPLPQ